MQEELISFETAKLAQEKGFKLDKYLSIDDENPKNLNSNYNPRKYQPWFYDLTQSLLQKWLREVHKISVCVDFRHSETNKIEGINSVYYDVNIYTLSQGDAFKTIKLSQINDSYEEALEIGLQEALKLI